MLSRGWLHEQRRGHLGNSRWLGLSDDVSISFDPVGTVHSVQEKNLIGKDWCCLNALQNQEQTQFQH